MEFERDVKKAVPMIMLVFISSATMINVFNIISVQMTVDFGISSATVSLLSMIAMLMMGVSSVAYSTLADYISVRKLMLFGICLLNAGALLGFLVSGINFYLILVAGAIMITGGTCGSGLMIIIVTRYIRQEDHARYYGFNTACVSMAQALGILLGGFFATYIGWRFGFLFPLFSLFAVPSIIRLIPDEKRKSEGRLDVPGLLLLTLFTLMISLCFNLNSVICFGAAVVLGVFFLIHIKRDSRAFISISFFQNKKFVKAMLLVAATFGIQTAYAFLFSFLATGIHGIDLSQVSLVLLPSYVIAAVIAMNSGKIVTHFGNFPTLCMALLTAMAVLIISALAGDKSIMLLGICACMFSGSYALVYAPFLQIVISSLKPDALGAGIGFFNLMTSIGPSLMIVLTGKMMATPLFAHSIAGKEGGLGIFSNILLLFAVILLAVLLTLILNRKSFVLKGEQER